jgi:predicted CXXCH cytochrome family protein
MAFLLRNISRSADGREIVRSSRVNDDLLKVGRDPDCDIRLNDLAVALHHATLELVSATKIGVSAEAGLTVEIDGSVTQFGQINLTTGGAVKVGPFLLRILPPEIGSEDVPIDIQRAEDDVAEQDDRFDTRRFALQSVLPGKRTISWVLTVLVLAIFLVWPIVSFYQNRGSSDRMAMASFHADQMWSSGDLSSAHAALTSNCQACHVQPFQPVQDNACKACHTNVHDHAPLAQMQRAMPQLAGLRGFQQSIRDTFGQTTGRCVECHTEHEGPQRMTPTPQQFCADCHTDLRSRLPQTRLGPASDFSAQHHPEFQPLVLTRWDNGQPQYQRVALNQHPLEMSNLKFPHALHLSATNGVAQAARANGLGQQLECASCHTPTGDGARFQPVDMARNCAACHDLAFDRIGGTLRTLRHGDPAQVIADIRGLYRAGGPAFPPELSPGGRARPGDANQIRAAVQFARAQADTANRGERAIQAIFTGDNGTCSECHVVQAPPPGTLNYRIAPVQFTSRYIFHGWFDHRPHQIVQRPGERRLEGSAGCLSCHNANASSSSSDVMLPNLASCQACHGGERTSLPVPSTCAMCHDYHIPVGGSVGNREQGVPTQGLRDRVRGRPWEPTVANSPPGARRP